MGGLKLFIYFKIRSYFEEKTANLVYATKNIRDSTLDYMQTFGVKKDHYKTFVEIVRDCNYPIEKHFYTTKDHYINCVFRISGPRGSNALQNEKRA